MLMSELPDRCQRSWANVRYGGQLLEVSDCCGGFVLMSELSVLCQRCQADVIFDRLLSEVSYLRCPSSYLLIHVVFH